MMDWWLFEFTYMCIHINLKMCAYLCMRVLFTQNRAPWNLVPKQLAILLTIEFLRILCAYMYDEICVEMLCY